ncbi:hypothetical protein BJX99DRAFT_239794 [Aspergillus californicus]
MSSYSGSEDDDELSDTPSITPRSHRGTRARALRDLRSSLPHKSVEAYTEFIAQESQPYAEKETFETTQDGIVIWTPQEKQILYQELDRKGKNGIRDISGAIGSKSELEVQEYLRLLQRGLRQYHFSEDHVKAAVLGEIPAAAEISEECCEALDSYAELLCLEEQCGENIAGRRKHKDLWIVNAEVAEKLEVDVAKDENRKDLSTIQNDEMINAATFFKLPNYILLSERFFMNFGGLKLEDNWVNVAFRDETPSLTADALTDLYDIALSATRRLVQAAHFFASSRVRRNTSKRPSAKVVKSSDVRGAARMLNMKRDSSEFWVGLARRCSLDVADIRHKKGWTNVRLDHDDVEDLLSQQTLPKEINVTEDCGRERSNSVGSQMSITSLREDDASDPEDEHAEAADQLNSSLGERLCWTVLGHSPPEALDAEDKILPRPAGKRKTMEDLVDWRDRTLYRSEWEEYGSETENLNRDLRNQHKKRRLKTSALSLSLSQPEPMVRDMVLDSISSELGPESVDSRQSELKTQPRSEPHYESESEDSEPGSESVESRQSELKTQPRSQPHYESESEDSDPAFRPEYSVQGKPNSTIPRSSARTRTSVSYALPQLLDFNEAMGMKMDIGSDLEDPDGALNSKPNSPDRQEEAISQEESGSGSDDSDDDGQRAGESFASASESESKVHLQHPRGENLSSDQEEDRGNQGEDKFAFASDDDTKVYPQGHSHSPSPKPQTRGKNMENLTSHHPTRKRDESFLVADSS